MYNLCSGRQWAIRDVLEFLLNRSRVRDIKVEVDPNRLRPSDVPLLLGDPSKIKRAVGWETTTPFEQTLDDLLDYWRGRSRPA